MKKYDGNVAFKCTYNDGGRNGRTRGFVGFSGTCSKENIIRNVEAGRVWCSHENNRCFQFYNNGCHGRRPRDPCYESRVLRDWRFGAGSSYDGDPSFMRSARKGKVALLTTRHPGYDTEKHAEKRRIVFGVFKIVNIDTGVDGEDWVVGAPESAIQVPEATALALPYWTFKKGVPIWGRGIFRYVSDQEITNYLHALFPRLQRRRDRVVLESLLECCGSLKPKSAGSDEVPVVEDEDLNRKYGPGGEGKRHRRLKEFVARHPERLGLGVGDVSVEHRFVTGDRVDLSIDLANGGHCVVEVEVEGDRSTLIGAHQALKYRALRAGELDETQLPHAFLVAYSIPRSTRRFCKRHGIRALEIQPT